MRLIKKEKLASSALFKSNFEFQDTEQYIEYFKKYKCPSKAKAALVMDVITSVPNINANGMAFTKETLLNSYQTMNMTALDYEHQQENILGSILNTEIIEQEDRVTLRTFAIAWKARMREWEIDDLSVLKYSMECLYSSYDFWTASKGIILKEDAPKQWIDELEINDWYKPVYDTNGERVALLIGGASGEVEFVGIGVVKNPADKTSSTLYQAASDKNNNDNKEEPIMFTQEQLDQALAELKEQLSAEFEAKSSEVVVQLEQATASLNEQNTKHEELLTKLAEAEAKVAEFEAELQKQAIAKLVNDRKQILASVNYPSELIDSKADFLASASDEDFGKLVDEFKFIAEKLSVKQTSASATEEKGKDFIPNLTVSNEEDKKLDISFLI